jgi:hypothetical protein
MTSKPPIFGNRGPLLPPGGGGGAAPGLGGGLPEWGPQKQQKVLPREHLGRARPFLLGLGAAALLFGVLIGIGVLVTPKVHGNDVTLTSGTYHRAVAARAFAREQAAVEAARVQLHDDIGNLTGLEALQTRLSALSGEVASTGSTGVLAKIVPLVQAELSDLKQMCSLRLAEARSGTLATARYAALAKAYAYAESQAAPIVAQVLRVYG